VKHVPDKNLVLEPKRKNGMRNVIICTAILIASLQSPTLAEESSSTAGALNRVDQEAFVPSGKARKVWSLYGTNTDCTPWNVKEIEAKTVQEPKNGTVQISETEVTAMFRNDTPSSKCSGKKMRALGVTYKSADKFVGTDEFELFVIWPNSRATELHFTINVK
jgi:hypothetical protein